MSILGRDGEDHRRGRTHNNNNNNNNINNNNDATHGLTGGRPSPAIHNSHVEETKGEDSGSHAHGSSVRHASSSGPTAGVVGVPPPRPSRGTNRGPKPTPRRSTLEVDPEADTSRWWGKLWAPDARVVDGHGDNDVNDDDDDTTSRYQSLEAPDVSQPSSLLLSSAIRHTTVTVEDRLKQDCSFFYQGMEAMTPQSHRRQPLASVLAHSGIFLSTSEGARFRATYERLNQEMTRTAAAAAVDDTADLFLDEDSSSPRPTPNGRQTDFSTRSTKNLSQNTEKLSTLFFEQDGRMLMKLPRDQVRLIMDPSLEPGIISVEQWRKVDQTIFDPAGPLVGDEEEGQMLVLDDPDCYPTKKIKQLPELRYVMTVPDDLYRRVVAEMSYALMPPWWGCFMCCSEAEGRADIKLALAILSVTLFLMFVSTMEWPTD
jgi:hypothetical protein